MTWYGNQIKSNDIYFLYFRLHPKIAIKSKNIGQDPVAGSNITSKWKNSVIGDVFLLKQLNMNLSNLWGNFIQMLTLLGTVDTIIPLKCHGKTESQLRSEIIFLKLNLINYDVKAVAFLSWKIFASIFYWFRLIEAVKQNIIPSIAKSIFFFCWRFCRKFWIYFGQTSLNSKLFLNLLFFLTHFRGHFSS